MKSANQAYCELIDYCLRFGDSIHTRNSGVSRPLDTGTICFKQTPLISVRKTPWKYALREMEWFLTGSDNINDLHKSVHHWWKPWADSNGKIRYNYGQQLRRMKWYNPETDAVEEFDQIAALLEGLRHHPNSRRNIIHTWYSPEMYSKNCPITNCHHSIAQAIVEDGYLYWKTYQRSVDVICGLPANWIQAWALMLWLAYSTNLKPGGLIWIGGDVHVYDAHKELAKKILSADYGVSPNLVYKPTSENFKASDFSLDGSYEPVLTDKAEMIV